MSEHYAEHWRVESDSRPGSFYTVSLMDSGQFKCSCKGWTMHTPRRDCRHIVYVRSGEAVQYNPMLRAMTLATAKAERAKGPNGS